MLDIKVSGQEISKTIAEIFSPLAEIAGVAADRVRIYRKVAVLRAVKRAKEIAEQEELLLDAPPLKFLLPYVEQASLEDVDDEQMAELWARLLVAASTSYSSEHAMFLRILGELTSKDAAVLKDLVQSDIHEKFLSSGTRPWHLEDVETNWKDGYVRLRIERLLNRFDRHNMREESWQEFGDALTAELQSPGSAITHFGIAEGRKGFPPYQDLWSLPGCRFDEIPAYRSTEVLQASGLVRRYDSGDLWVGGLVFEVSAVHITVLGSLFYEACTGKKTKSGAAPDLQG